MRMLFVNLPVKDVAASRSFFAELGFSFHPGFSDADCACMVIDRNIFAMLMRHDRFTEFINGRIADTFDATAVINCLSADSPEQVDDTVTRAIAAGGRAWKPTVQQGPMYGGSFQDLDGHVWEILHMAA